MLFPPAMLKCLIDKKTPDNCTHYNGGKNFFKKNLFESKLFSPSVYSYSGKENHPVMSFIA
jgi:hypothetical protein